MVKERSVNVIRIWKSMHKFGKKICCNADIDKKKKMGIYHNKFLVFDKYILGI
jgi:hypothetical protein